MNASIRAPVGMIALSGVLWGTSFVAMKVGLGYVDPYSFAFLRLVTASVFSAALLFVRERPKLNVLRDRRIWVLGILNAGGFILQYVGISYTTANRTALITNSNVAFTAFLSWSLYHEPMGFGNLLALPLSVLGLFLLVTGGDLSTLSGGQVMGDLLVLLAGLVWSFFLVLNKDIVSRRSTNVSQMVAWVMLVTTIGIAPVAFLFGGCDECRRSIGGMGSCCLHGSSLHGRTLLAVHKSTKVCGCNLVGACSVDRGRRGHHLVSPDSR